MQLKTGKDELHLLETKKRELEKRVLILCNRNNEQITEDQESQENSKASLQREKEKAAEALNKRLESNKAQKEALENEKANLREKEVELEELKTKISALYTFF